MDADNPILREAIALCNQRANVISGPVKLRDTAQFKLVGLPVNMEELAPRLDRRKEETLAALRAGDVRLDVALASISLDAFVLGYYVAKVEQGRVAER